MRIGLAQINPVLGDFKSNREKIRTQIEEAVAKKCALVVFPECALFGYHPFDLLERTVAVERQLKELNALHGSMPEGVAAVVGVITLNPSPRGRPYFNSAALLVKGKPIRFFHKTLLPTGDVFDEARFIEHGDVSKNRFSWKGKKFLLTICEDIWAWPERDGSSAYVRNPLAEMPKRDCDLVLNLSASPWHLGKTKLRERVVAKTAAWFKAPVLYVNMVGAQDEIIFDGRSLVFDAKGTKRFEGLAFEEQLNVVDSETLESWDGSPAIDEKEELRRGLVLGIRDFCAKAGMGAVHLGLSGGIDSAVVACLAVDAMGPSKVRVYAMPGPFNEARSLTLAQELAANLGLALGRLDVTPVYERIVAELERSVGVAGFGVLHENLQARVRGIFMMAVSNKENSLLLATSNKSEMATGYSTLYGDMCGGLAPIADLTKEQVYALAALYNSEREVIPGEIITRPPSAELRPNQKDQDSLPPYDVLDQAVVRVVEKEGAARTETEKWLTAQLFRSEFKRWQAPPILKASRHSFGRGRRFPVAHKHRES